MNSAFNQNQTELRISVLSVPLQMLAHGDGLLDQVVQVFRQVWSKTFGLEDAKDLVSGHESNLKQVQ